MATTVTSAWLKPGAWALDSEEQEAVEALEKRQQERQQQVEKSDDKGGFDFPSLSEAVSSKPSRKKKAQQTFSLAEFTTGKSVSHGTARSSSSSSSSSKGLTPEELLALPTGPRQRSAEELDRSDRLGGAFRSYSSGPRSRGSEDDSASRWDSSSRNSSDESRHRNGFNRDAAAPSRADEIDDWSKVKKSVPPPLHPHPHPSEGRARGGFFDSHSRADGADSWLSNKPAPPPTDARRFGGGFEGFRDRKGGLETESDSWGRKKDDVGERRRLVLQPRTLPVNNPDPVPVPVPAAVVQQPRGRGSNPFGEARPREEILAEKGQDWKKIDEQLESVKIKEVAGGAPVSAEGIERSAKGGFGTGNGRASPPEGRTERSWRKPDSNSDHGAAPRSVAFLTSSPLTP